MSATVGIERIVEKPGQHDVDHRSPGLDQLDSGFACVVMHPDHCAFEAQERFARGEPGGDRHVALEIQSLKGMLVDASDHGEI